MIQEFTNLVHKKVSGWVAYKEYNPADLNKVMHKTSFVELVDGMVICCGVYE